MPVLEGLASIALPALQTLPSIISKPNAQSANTAPVSQAARSNAQQAGVVLQPNLSSTFTVIGGSTNGPPSPAYIQAAGLALQRSPANDEPVQMGFSQPGGIAGIPSYVWIIGGVFIGVYYLAKNR